MAAGTFTYSSTPVALGRTADLVVAALYDESQTPPWRLLPNVMPVSAQWFEGPQPPVARFRYVFSPALIGTKYPTHLEDVFPLDAANNTYVLDSNDRVGIFRFSSSGATTILFDGFTLSPQGNISATGEEATITAVGVPHREFDTPLGGALMRWAATPTRPNTDLATGLPMRFNPEGFPNCSPDETSNPGAGNYDSTIDDPRDGHAGETIKFPVFLGPVPPQNQLNPAADEDLRVWSLDLAVLHILAQVNPKMTYVDWDWRVISDTLKAQVPTAPGTPINVFDSSTYNLEPIDLDDIDVTGMCWPESVSKIITTHGFQFKWQLDIDDGLVPTWSIVFYRLDDVTGAKYLLLQNYGGVLDPGKTNVQELSLSRDSHAVLTKVIVDMEPTLVEAGFILAPGFDIAAADLTTLEHYVLGDTSCTGANLDKYRLFVLDEAGEGHWDLSTNAPIAGGALTPPELKDVFSTQSVYGKAPPPGGVMICRRRKPLSPIISLDEETQEPQRAKLYVSFDYGRTKPGAWDASKPVPGVYDGVTGTWDEVQSSEWTLLDDRIGVRLTCRDPSEFHIGQRAGWETYSGAFASVKYPEIQDGILQIPELLASVDGFNGWNQPVFMLVCAVSADTGPLVVADGQKWTPLKATITRRYDARHRFKKRVISKFSFLSPTLGVSDEVLEDDTEDAKAMAQTMLRAHQFPAFAGSVVIPRLTLAYRVGDKLTGVLGRDLGFRQNAGTAAGSSNVYPAVASVEWQFEGDHRTTLQLSDRRAEYAPRRQHQRKPHFHSFEGKG